jgi:hypothetical protein
MNDQSAAPADIKTNRILVSVVLDRSGSMASVRESTIAGYNEYLNGLRADKDSEYSLTLIQFDMVAAKADLTISYVDKPLADVNDLTAADYEPRGSTPLYDAIGECIRRTEARGRGVITLIITDGQENASTEFTRDAVKALIADKEKEGWSFAFLGANIDSYAVGGSLGVSAANVANYAVGNEQVAFRAFTSSVGSYAADVRHLGVRGAAVLARPRFDNAQRAAMAAPTTPVPPAAKPVPSFRPPVKAAVEGDRRPRNWREA